MPFGQAASKVHHMQAALTRATEDSYNKLDYAGQGCETAGAAKLTPDNTA